MSPIPETIVFPLIGELVIKELSLPVLTFLVALLDGFNPCAMWVLLFLVSLLLGMENRLKMIILGTVFILTSGLVYFLFLSAWLNLFLFLGFMFWVRIVVGAFAIGVGFYYLRDFYLHKTGCKVVGKGKRKKVFERLRGIVQSRSFLLAIVGIILLAFAVNLVELVCSAGLPAIYTQVLALTPMPRWQYYLYLIFYVVVFMIDDLAVFLIAMVTLRAAGVESKYVHFTHLIGGLGMLIIGLLMLFKPELLMFG